MRNPDPSLRRTLAALAVAVLGLAGPVAAQDAAISLNVSKAGFVVGVSTGYGVLDYRGDRYRLSITGVSVGLTIGAATARLSGDVYNLGSVDQIEGTYLAVQASAAAGDGGHNWVLENERGVRLVVRGAQTGLEASLDAGGMVVRLK